MDRSHIDRAKLNKVPTGQPFLYKDIVQDDYPDEEHTADGKRFKEEVERGMYSSVVISQDNGNRLLYKKL
ncbi:MAG: hypothetical protein Q8936_10470 [Bacillota bacterium]|nr:hypothetical protein [Bacillota bacterium]